MFTCRDWFFIFGGCAAAFCFGYLLAVLLSG